MSDEKSTEIFLTFLFAMIGYAGLTVTLLISLKRIVPLNFWRLINLVILIHVVMVWTYRYNWQFYLSIRNGYSGFLIFHSALLLILLSNIVKENIAKTLIKISFIVVTTGAVGAVFKYDVVAVYRIPVIVFALMGIGGLLQYYIQNASKTQ